MRGGHLDGCTNNEEECHEVELDATVFEHIHFEIDITCSPLLQSIENRRIILIDPRVLKSVHVPKYGPTNSTCAI